MRSCTCRGGGVPKRQPDAEQLDRDRGIAGVSDGRRRQQRPRGAELRFWSTDEKQPARPRRGEAGKRVSGRAGKAEAAGVRSDRGMGLHRCMGRGGRESRRTSGVGGDKARRTTVGHGEKSQQGDQTCESPSPPCSMKGPKASPPSTVYQPVPPHLPTARSPSPYYFLSGPGCCLH